MTKQEALDIALKERNAEKLFYTTEESLAEHKEYCDVVASELEKSIKKEERSKKSRRIVYVIYSAIVSSLAALGLRVLLESILDEFLLEG